MSEFSLRSDFSLTIPSIFAHLMEFIADVCRLWPDFDEDRHLNGSKVMVRLNALKRTVSHFTSNANEDKQ